MEKLIFLSATQCYCLLSVIVVISTEPRYCFQLDVKSQCLNENTDNGMLSLFYL